MGAISKNYLYSGAFFIDSLATFPTLMTGQVVDSVNFLKFLRLRDFFRMFGPFVPVFEKLMPNMDTHLKTNVIEFLQMIVSTMLLAHFFACIWLILGMQDLDQPEHLKHSWAARPSNGFQGYSEYQLYVFAYYWIFEVITTVGYGDYTPSTMNEYIFAIILEFCGMTFFSLLMGLVANFVGTFNMGFDSLMQVKMDELNQWVKKIERSDKPNYMNPALYFEITTQI